MLKSKNKKKKLKLETLQNALHNIFEPRVIGDNRSTDQSNFGTDLKTCPLAINAQRKRGCLQLLTLIVFV